MSSVEKFGISFRPLTGLSLYLQHGTTWNKVETPRFRPLTGLSLYLPIRIFPLHMVVTSFRPLTGLSLYLHYPSFPAKNLAQSTALRRKTAL